MFFRLWCRQPSNITNLLSVLSSNHGSTQLGNTWSHKQCSHYAWIKQHDSSWRSRHHWPQARQHRWWNVFSFKLVSNSRAGSTHAHKKHQTPEDQHHVSSFHLTKLTWDWKKKTKKRTDMLVQELKSIYTLVVNGGQQTRRCRLDWRWR